VEGQVVHLQRFDNYWNATGLKNAGLFQMKDYYIRFIADKTSALAALKNGEVDMLDYNYQMQTDIPTIDSSWGKVINLDGVGRQEFGYNMRHPIFGTGVDTPLGKSDPSRAAEAARYVRTAFDYAVPRELIIKNLLAGYGLPGVTPMVPTQAFYDDSVKARPYDLSQARQYLELAGYSPPSVNLGNVVNLQGTATPNATVKLMETTDNSTFPNSLTLVTQTTADIDGFYSFAIPAPTSGTHYYYALDATTEQYTYLQSFTPQADNTLMYAIVAAVIIVVVIVVVWLVAKRRRK
jgi:ABC-type transport system substrate-binding protein